MAMDEIKLLILIIVLWSSAGASKKDCRMDTAIIIQAPPYRVPMDDFVDMLIELEASLCKDTRFGIILAGKTVQVLRKLNCENGWECISMAPATLNAELAYPPPAYQSKSNTIRAVMDIEKLMFHRVHGARENVKKRIIIVPTTPKIDSLSLSDSLVDLLEDRVPIIALAVGEGRDENLRYITLGDNRIIKVRSFERINNRAVIDRLKTLLQDPEDKSQNVVMEDTDILPNLQGSQGVKQLGSSIPDQPVLSKYEILANEVLAADEICEYKVDIAFLVDSSNSIKLDYQTELLFVQRIANRFNITETGTHAGVVIFSDIGYVKMTIRMDQFYNTKDFNRAVRQSPFFGWRTRIDLGFNVVQDELLTIAGGARPNMKKILILITDGRQYPVRNEETGEKYDPIAASQLMYDNKVSIFAVGIGKHLQKDQLERITRDPHRVFYSETFDKLISDEFVKSVSKESCFSGGDTDGKPNTTETCVTNKTASPCGTSGCCGCCCPSNVYINIFQSGSGPNYVMQGATVTQTGNTADQINANVIPNPHPTMKVVPGAPIDKDKLMQVIKSSITNPKLVTALETLIDNSIKVNSKTSIPVGPVAEASRKRARRSLITIPERLPRFSEILKVAKMSGCKKFIEAIEKYGITKEIDSYVAKNKTVTLFCPLDSALEDFTLYPSEKDKKEHVREVLRHHVAVKHDSHGTMYHSVTKHGRITIHPTYTNKQEISWAVEDAKMKFSLYDGKYGEIVVIDRLLSPPLRTLRQAIKHHPNLTHMYALLNKYGGIHDLLHTKNIEKICFKDDLCVPMSEDMKDRVRQAIIFKQITLLAPTDRVFEAMGKWDILKLYSNKEKLRSFLENHIYLGIVNKDTLTEEMNILTQSVATNNPVAVIHNKKGVAMVTTSNESTLRLTESIRVSEGMVMVEDL